ncbi:MAG: hypothetical protein A2928_00415 [Candidatus Taylorbacteria bacterium RIFCSPLOWO2_01_FULL_45_15b]|uniref:DUF2238 domain-containing protein n=1 Tax=Candidatus Taylorbacteria bacterium RIFCSPLOWO2_01_FULL_45_15b TaxID=1802319 RepID=A0A1G2N7P6_9BACT|nr:MAG: hypothetical protein A2928_00415 [Candidatus Taylorbacteria bacterium RIFCSPLOWO2_01_FULL_45_15b]
MTRYQKFLCAAFAIAWAWAAYKPLYRDDWLLENYLVFVAVPLIFIVGRYFKLSSVSYTLITIFLILHVIGSHYTYAEVPIGEILKDWFNTERNMYDRLVHFGFGFLLAYPAREVFVRLSQVKGFWGYYFPLDVVLAGSAFYEIIEWLAAQKVDAEAGLAFLGSQGDIWDAQKDMLVAGIGAFIAMLIIFLINRRFNKSHWQEIWSSLKIPKGDRPLGEERLKEFLKKANK